MDTLNINENLDLVDEDVKSDPQIPVADTTLDENGELELGTLPRLPELLNPSTNVRNVNAWEEAMEAYQAPQYEKPSIIDDVRHEKEMEEADIFKTKTDEVIKALPANTPTNAIYDYGAGVANGNQYKPGPDGSVELPNKDIRPMKAQFAGHDISTTNKIFDQYEDTDGLVADAVNRVHGSTTNSVGGAPVQDSEALVRVAATALDEGKDESYYGDSVTTKYSEQEKKVAWEAANNEEIFRGINSGKYNEQLAKIPDAPELSITEPFDEDQLANNKHWLNDNKMLYEYMEGESFTGTLEDLHSWALHNMSKKNAPTWGAALLIRASLAPDDAQAAFYRVMSVYQKSELSWAQFGRGTAYNVFDVTSYLAASGVGTPAAVTARISTQVGMKKVMSIIFANMMSKGLVTAAEGAVYATLDDYYAQMIGGVLTDDKEYSLSQTAGHAAMGAVGGAVLGTGIGSIYNSAAGKYSGNLIKKNKPDIDMLDSHEIRQLNEVKKSMAVEGTDFETAVKDTFGYEFNNAPLRVQQAVMDELVDQKAIVDVTRFADTANTKGLAKAITEQIEILKLSADVKSDPQIPIDKAHTVKGRTIEELKVAIPNEERSVLKEAQVASEGPIRMNSGANFKDVDLEAQGQTMSDRAMGESTIREAWDDALGKSPDKAKELASKLKMAPKDFEFWNKALSLPDRARYWYEISTEGMKEMLPGLGAKQLSQFFDVVGATSPQADPNINMRRALSSLGYVLAEKPVNTALSKKAGDKGGAVRTALAGEESQTNKIHNFSGTFDYLAGHTKDAPLSTNDRQVASSFGIDESKLFSNQSVYEPVSRFYISLRDRLNANLKEGEEPYQAWQLQALGWVQERIDKDASKGRVSSNDDYLMAMEKVRKEAVQQGLMKDGEPFSEKVLKTQEFQDIVDPTTNKFDLANVATIEAMSEKSPQTARLLSLGEQLSQDKGAQRKLNQSIKRTMDAIITRTSEAKLDADGNKMYDAKGKLQKVTIPSLASRVMMTVQGTKRVQATDKEGNLLVNKDGSPRMTDKAPKEITRIDIGEGTYEGNLNQNMRIPLSGATDGEMKDFLAIFGKGLNQDLSPASLYKTAQIETEPAAGATRTYQLFVNDFAEVPLKELGEMLPKGHELSVKHAPNGTVIDVTPKFLDNNKKEGIDAEELERIVLELFDGREIGITPTDFTSIAVNINEADAILTKLSARITTEAVNQLREVLPNVKTDRIRKALSGKSPITEYSVSQ
ncbi:MAG TPA: hypothetical protein EYQ42_04515, partial [Thiotrichaceae bacterium]|nr:hypothetical protein [Thiotrichaceae bacterium]